LLGMIAEVAMKARMLRAKLKKDPDSVVEVATRLEALEQEMFLCMVEFDEIVPR
jgi:membrane-bound lytic murein transglycosylase MltF